jgi:hypothetical protein
MTLMTSRAPEIVAELVNISKARSTADEEATRVTAGAESAGIIAKHCTHLKHVLSAVLNAGLD